MKRFLRNYWAAIISAVLVSVLTVMFMPNTFIVAADSIRAASTTQQEEQDGEENDYEYEPEFDIDTTDQESDEKEIEKEFEMTERRSEYEKSYYMSDGTIRIETYVEPVNYKDEDGTYKEIDNTLVEFDDNGVEKFKNANNGFSVEFNKQITKNNPMMSISKDEYKLEMYLEQNDNLQMDSFVEKADMGELTEHRSQLTAESDKEVLSNKRFSGKLKYSDLRSNVDMEYHIDGQSLQESIIIGAPDSPSKFDCEIRTEGLYLQAMDDGGISAYNGAGELIFGFAAPEMLDAAGEVGDVNYQLGFIEEYRYRLTLAADSEWLTSSDRQFPVIISPTVKTPYNTESFSVTQENGFGEKIEKWYLEHEFDSADNNRLIIDYNVPHNDKAVFNRVLEVKLKNGEGAVGHRDIEIPETLEYEINNDYFGVTDGEITTIDITVTEGSGTVYIDFPEDFDINAQIQTIAVLTTTTEESGIESSYDAYTYGGNTYTIYVKPKTMSYTVELPLVTSTEPNVPLNIIEYYNPGYSDIIKNNICAYKSSLQYSEYYGKDIKLNVEQYIWVANTAKARYIDADGAIHMLSYGTNGLYSDDNGNIHYSDTQNLMTDKNGNIIAHFDSYGRADKIYSSGDGYLSVSYEGNTNKISSVKSLVQHYVEVDPVVNQTVIMVYDTNNSNAEMIGMTNYNGNEIISLNYNNGYLTEANMIGANYKLFTLEYQDYNIETVINQGKGHQITIKNNMVSNVSLTNISCLKKLSDFSKKGNNTVISLYNGDGATKTGETIYSYDNSAELLSKAETPQTNTSPINIVTYTNSKKDYMAAEFVKKDDNYLIYGASMGNVEWDITSKIGNYKYPAFVIYAFNQGNPNSEITIYSVDNENKTKSDVKTLFSDGAYYLLPLSNSVRKVGIKAPQGVQSFYIGLGEMTLQVKSTKDYDEIITIDGTTKINYKNGRKVKEEFNGKNSNGSEKIITTYSYVNNYEDLVSEIICEVIDNGITTNQREVYSYEKDENSWLTITRKSYTGSIYQLTETYEYDPFGYLETYDNSNGESYEYRYLAYNDIGDLFLEEFVGGPYGTVTYKCNKLGLTTQMTDNRGTVKYCYDGMTCIGYNYGSINYKYEFDEWGNIISINRNGEELIHYNLTDYYTDRLCYPNGKFDIYNYREDGQLETHYYNDLFSDEITYYKYYYNDIGQLNSIVDNDRNTQYIYGKNYITETETIDGIEEFKKTAYYGDNEQYSGTDYIVKNNSHSSSVQTRIDNRIESETDGPFKTDYTYTDGRITGISRNYKNGSDYVVYDNIQYTYNNGLVTKIDSSASNDYQYIYDENNNIIREKVNEKDHAAYTYDSAGRLSKEYNYLYDSIYGTSLGYYMKTHVYDEYNNLIALTTEVYNDVDYKQVNCSYDGDRLVSVSILATIGEEEMASDENWDGSLNITYDNYGNPIQYGEFNLSWTQGNKLRTIAIGDDQYRYSYNGNGIRNKKEYLKDGKVVSTTKYYLDGSMIIAEDRDGVLIQYYYDNSGVIGMSYNNEDYYFNKNLYGDIVEIRKATDNTLVTTYGYDAWGNCSLRGEEIGLINPFRYRGYYQDDETGFYYLQTRYYNAVVGRFLNADNYELLPILSQDIGSMNLYTYCGNNPVMYTDENGEFWLTTFLITVTISSLVGAVSGGISAYLAGKNFWLGFAAGALAGAIGGAIGSLSSLSSLFAYLGTGISSLLYNVLNEQFQNGSLNNIDWSYVGEDVGKDLLSYLFIPSFGGDRVQELYKSALMGVADVTQTAIIQNLKANSGITTYYFQYSSQFSRPTMRKSRCQAMPTNIHLRRAYRA